ncbi:MAG: hypothetical protein KGL46_04600 [Hyphomicrobiales bacterium]|nr:hypothetical protein [Hyphomicrobiales bacterium]
MTLAQAAPTRRTDPLVVFFCIALVAVFAAGALNIALVTPFPAPIDELEHYSFMRALASAPTLFPHYGTYRVLSTDLSHWTDRINYIAHPPLYYLLLAPTPADIATLRFINVAIATLGVAFSAAAVARLAPSRVSALVSVVLVTAFARTIATGGLINNDNLVVLETGAVFFVLSGQKDRPGALALLLALTGWTKLNGFVALALIVGALHLVEIVRGRAGLFSRRSFILVAGVLAGFVPTIGNLVTIHAAVYAPADFLFVPEAARRQFDGFWSFADFFVHRLGQKFPPVEGSFDATPLLAAILGVAIAGLFAERDRLRDMNAAFLVALAAFFAIHLVYGWRSYVAFGSISDAQMRYYNALWPFIAFACATGLDAMIAALRKSRPPAGLSEKAP